MRVGKPVISFINGEVSYQCAVDGQTLWFSIQKEFADLVLDKSDAGLVAILYPAMIAGEEIACEGAISEQLYYNVNGPLQEMLRIINPKLNIIKVHARDLHREPSSSGVMTGFSRGVDSYSLIKRHLLGNPFPGYRVTHLSLHDIWGEGNKIGNQNPVVNNRYLSTKSIVDEWKLPLVLINSNVGDFYRGLRFEDTHSLRNAAAAHVCARGVGKYLYASTMPLKLQRYSSSYDIAHGDSVILPLASSSAISCISGDAEVSRLQKTMSLADLPSAQKFLQVCANTVEYNCSECWKCMRTCYSLDVIGKLDKFSGAFNIEKYKSKKEEYINSMIGRGDEYFDEIRAFVCDRC